MNNKNEIIAFTVFITVAFSICLGVSSAIIGNDDCGENLGPDFERMYQCYNYEFEVEFRALDYSLESSIKDVIEYSSGYSVFRVECANLYKYEPFINPIILDCTAYYGKDYYLARGIDEKDMWHYNNNLFGVAVPCIPLH